MHANPEHEMITAGGQELACLCACLYAWRHSSSCAGQTQQLLSGCGDSFKVNQDSLKLPYRKGCTTLWVWEKPRNHTERWEVHKRKAPWLKPACSCSHWLAGLISPASAELQHHCPVISLRWGRLDIMFPSSQQQRKQASCSTDLGRVQVETLCSRVPTAPCTRLAPDGFSRLCICSAGPGNCITVSSVFLLRPKRMLQHSWVP